MNYRHMTLIVTKFRNEIFIVVALNLKIDAFSQAMPSPGTEAVMSHYNVSALPTEAVEESAAPRASCSLTILQPETKEAVSIASVGQRLRFVV